MQAGTRGTLYQAIPDFTDDLATEVAGHAEPLPALPGCFWTNEPARQCTWAQQTWIDAEVLEITSIKNAASQLRERGPWWGLHPGQHIRRSQLIADQLLKWKQQAQIFPPRKDLRPLGQFTLIDKELLLCAAQTARPYIDGVFQFEEDHVNPPSRAYRKIWEALLLLGEHPKAGEHCVDCGASPGAWTWALAEIGARVTSIDKAPLDPRIDAHPLVNHRIGSAFALDPRQENFDWFFSDVICYPERLLNMIDRWLAEGTCEKFVITVKFQGKTDFDAIAKFKDYPSSMIVHLHHNKHEVTWIRHPRLSGQIAWPWLHPPAQPE